MGEYLTRVQQQKLGMNVAFLTGHNTIRRAVMGTENRAPTDEELRRMRSMVAVSMGQGAFGLSTGLRYIPGFYSNIDEVIALSQVAADSGGIYTSHLREEGVGLLDGVAEALEIGRRARIPVVLTHHKAVGPVSVHGEFDRLRRARSTLGAGGWRFGAAAPARRSNPQ